jgi:hypothetical protein
MKDSTIHQPEKKKRKWGEFVLGVLCGLTLGIPLLVYVGIRKVSGDKLPEVSPSVKKGALVGLAVAVSVFGTVFSGGFAAPTVPAIIAGALTAAAGVGAVVISDDHFGRRAEEQQATIQALQSKVNQLNVQPQLVKQQNKSSGRADDKDKNTSQQRSAPSASVADKQRPRFKTKRSSNQRRFTPDVRGIVRLETTRAVVERPGEELSPSSTASRSNTRVPAKSSAR